MMRKASSKTSLSFKLGNWLEADATGWGVVAIPILGLMLMGAAWLGSATSLRPSKVCVHGEGRRPRKRPPVQKLKSR